VDHSKTSLRIAHVKDVSILLPLVADYHEFEGIQCAESKCESAIRKLLSHPEFGAIWLIYSANELAGYIVLCRGYSIEFSGFDAFIDEFYLKPDFRGKGVGYQVLKNIKTEAKKFEINALHLEVSRRNDRAQKLYKKAGFEAREKYILMSVDL